MSKAKKLLKLCLPESNTSDKGKVEHNHPEIFDDNGVLINVGKANNGPPHKHGVQIDKQGNIKIKSAGTTDPKDPSHSHDPSEEAIKSTKDAFLKSFDKDAE